ncbi:MAG: transketolase [Chloroflexota bacterium]|nr:transketolase [Chloroflexota bacterium]
MTAQAKTIRRHIVTTISHAQAGHPGGSLSAADILTALYFHVLRVDPAHPNWPQRDRFILSKGHAAAGLYAALAERGFFPLEWLETFGQINSHLQVHPDMHKVTGIEISTGALGMGLSVGLGMALAIRADGLPGHVYVLLGDGESQEGQVWEAAMAGGHYRPPNLTAIVDYNNVQLLGAVTDIMDVAPLPEKWRTFGWRVLEIDGHNMQAVVAALEEARDDDVPTAIIAHTIKGKGVSFMEGQAAWHGQPPNAEQLAQALEELA